MYIHVDTCYCHIWHFLKKAPIKAIIHSDTLFLFAKQVKVEGLVCILSDTLSRARFLYTRDFRFVKFVRYFQFEL